MWMLKQAFKHENVMTASLSLKLACYVRYTIKYGETDLLEECHPRMYKG
jgi:hypothetical protein